MRVLLAIVRVVLALAVLAAIVAQLDRSAANWVAGGVTDFVVTYTNFFSFFTIESGAATVVVCLLGAYFLVARRGQPDPYWFTGLRAAIVTYMVATGIVYNLLLRNNPQPPGTTVPWSNEILHVVAPLWMLLDWLLVPGRRELAWKTVWLIVVFPIAWCVYTLVRAPLTPDEMRDRAYWYPYPFLNPHLSPSGYLSVSVYIVLIAAAIGLIAAGAVWVSKRRSIGSR